MRDQEHDNTAVTRVRSSISLHDHEPTQSRDTKLIINNATR